MIFSVCPSVLALFRFVLCFQVKTCFVVQEMRVLSSRALRRLTAAHHAAPFVADTILPSLVRFRFSLSFTIMLLPRLVVCFLVLSILFSSVRRRLFAIFAASARVVDRFV